MARWRPPWFEGYYVGLLLLLYLPIALLFLFSFNASTSLTFPLKGFTLKWYGQMTATPAVMGSLRNSVVVAAGSSTIATLLGTAGAVAITRLEFRGKALFVGLAILPLVVPFVVLGVSVLLLFRSLGVPLSLWTVAAAHTVVTLPYTLLIVSARMVGFDPNLEEAALDLGASNFQVLTRIVVPNVAPAMLAAWLTAATISFDEFAIANFLAGTAPTFPLYLFSQLRFTNRLPMMVAAAGSVMVVTLVLVLISEWLRGLGSAPAAAQTEGPPAANGGAEGL